jgi:hypothetical protein
VSDYQPTDLVEQEKDQQDRILRDRLEQETAAADVKWLMSSKRGRRIVWRLMADAGVFRSVFNTNSMAMAFSEGNRNTGLRMFNSVMELCPEMFSVMTKEMQNDSTDDAGRNHSNH